MENDVLQVREERLLGWWILQQVQQSSFGSPFVGHVAVDLQGFEAWMNRSIMEGMNVAEREFPWCSDCHWRIVFRDGSCDDETSEFAEEVETTLGLEKRVEDGTILLVIIRNREFFHVGIESQYPQPKIFVDQGIYILVSNITGHLETLDSWRLQLRNVVAIPSNEKFEMTKAWKLDLGIGKGILMGQLSERAYLGRIELLTVLRESHDTLHDTLMSIRTGEGDQILTVVDDVQMIFIAAPEDSKGFVSPESIDQAAIQ